MVYYINESNDNTSLDSIFNEFNIMIAEASHEYEMSIMRVKYNFLNENGYEMPIHEAEEKKQGIFRKLIQNFRDGLANLKDKIIKKLNDFANNHPNNIIAKAIKKIKFIYKKADNDIKNASTAEVAKKELKAASTDMNDTSNGAMKDSKNSSDNNTEEKPIGTNDKNTTEKDDLISHYEKMGFNDEQLKKIKHGINNGYPKDIIDMYANPKFNASQMSMIRYGFKHNLTKDQIAMYADPKFSDDQMFEIIDGFENSLTKDQVDMYADPKFSADQMQAIAKFIKKNNPTKEEVEEFINNIENGKEENKSDSKDTNTSSDSDKSKINATTEVRKNNLLPQYEKMGFNQRQMKVIKSGINKGLSKDKIDMYAKKHFDENQMSEIKYGFEKGLTEDQVSMYADPKFNAKQMNRIADGLIKGFSKDQVAMYADPKFNDKQMAQIMIGFKRKFSESQIKELISNMEGGKKEKKPEENTSNSNNKDKVFNPFVDFNSEKDKKDLISSYREKGLNNDQIAEIAKAIKQGVSRHNILNFIGAHMKRYGYLDAKSMGLIRQALVDGFPTDRIKSAANPMNEYDEVKKIIDFIRTKPTNTEFDKFLESL